MDKKTKLIVIISSSVVLVASVIGLFFALKKKNDGTSASVDVDELKENPKEEIKTVPKATWPLKKGSVAREMINVRIGLGLSPGYNFDNEVESVLYSKFKAKEITQSDYRGMIAMYRKWGMNIVE